MIVFLHKEAHFTAPLPHKAVAQPKHKQCSGTMPAQPYCAGITSMLKSDFGNKTVRNDSDIALMVQEAMEMSQKLGSDNALLAHMGARFPQPKHYSGEPDLKNFKVFVAGLLWGMSVNLLLGSSDMHTLVQLRCLGACLKGAAFEWYFQEVEHYARSTRRWTLKSALVRLQGQFMHTFTYKHMSIQFDTAQQGSGMVQDLLNKLTRAAA